MSRVNTLLLSPIFAGIAGVELPMDRFDLGQGVYLRRTYCSIFAPYMAAFIRPEPGKAHPAPWKHVGGGTYHTILTELHIPFASVCDFDRINTVWWLAALLRMQGNHRIVVPVISNCAFAEIATLENEEPTFLPIEVARRATRGDAPDTGMKVESLDWIFQHWQAGAMLMQNHQFNVAFRAFDQSTADRSASVGLVTLWGALEQLFLPVAQELSFRASAIIAAYLEPSGEARLAQYKIIKRLYAARSKAAHGAIDSDEEPFLETYCLLRRVITKMIELRHVPDRDELESLVFI